MSVTCYPGLFRLKILRKLRVSPHRRFGTRIWVNPADVQFLSFFPDSRLQFLSERFFWWGNWDRARERFSDKPDYAFTLQRQVEGIPWGSTGSFEALRDFILTNGSFDGWSANQESIERRHRQLDQLWDSLAGEHLLRSRAELSGNACSEAGGVLVFLGRTGEIFFGGAGQHRLAMSQILQLPEIPVWLGGVSGHLARSWKKYVNLSPQHPRPKL